MPLPKLLIVEDDEDTSRQLTWGLKEDFDLVTAGDRYQALRRARIDHPDVILLDLGLPPSPADPEEGLRLMQDLRKGGTGKIIVYTGCGQWEHAVRATSYGAFDVLTKPVDLEALRFLLHRVYARLDERVRIGRLLPEGADLQPGRAIAAAEGPARALLTGERVALNFLQHLSGIASLTSRYVKAVEGTKTLILDTRKTTPGLRTLEKYATRMGGAVNHRMGLYDQVLIKDTHLALANGVSPALRAVRKAHPEAPINVEVSNLQELEQASAKRRAAYVPVDSTLPLADLVFAELRRRRVLA